MIPRKLEALRECINQQPTQTNQEAIRDSFEGAYLSCLRAGDYLFDIIATSALTTSLALHIQDYTGSTFEIPLMIGAVGVLGRVATSGRRHALYNEIFPDPSEHQHQNERDLATSL